MLLESRRCLYELVVLSRIWSGSVVTEALTESHSGWKGMCVKCPRYSWKVASDTLVPWSQLTLPPLLQTTAHTATRVAFLCLPSHSLSCWGR